MSIEKQQLERCLRTVEVLAQYLFDNEVTPMSSVKISLFYTGVREK